MSASLMVPTAVPAADVEQVESTEAEAVQPFGLRFAEVVPAGAGAELSGLRWDEERQVTVLADGSALADNPLTMETWAPTPTKYDNQPETDQIKVD